MRITALIRHDAGATMNILCESVDDENALLQATAEKERPYTDIDHEMDNPSQPEALTSCAAEDENRSTETGEEMMEEQESPPVSVPPSSSYEEKRQRSLDRIREDNQHMDRWSREAGLRKRPKHDEDEPEYPGFNQLDNRYRQ